MITAAMSYVLAVSLLLTLTAFALERVTSMFALPRRMAWIAAMIVSIAIMAPLLLHAAPAQNHATAATPIDVAMTQARIAFAWAPSPAWPMWKQLDAVLIGLWGLMSASMTLFLISMSWRLQRRLAACPMSTVEQRAVLVADDVGPAVFGAWKPRIIMPRWLMEAPQTVRSAALQHEHQHVAARDGLLFAGALALVVMAPWNLALWIQLRRLRFAIEVDCDARVLKSGIDASAYGEALLVVGQIRSNAPIGAITLAEPASQLERRLRIMLLDKPRRTALATLAFLALAAAPVAYAASLAPPSANTEASAATSGDASAAVAFSSDSVESLQHGAVLVLSGNVRVEAPASIAIAYSSNSITRQPDGVQVLEGAVVLTVEQSRIATERAVVTRSANGDAVISMDRAEVVRAR